MIKQCKKCGSKNLYLEPRVKGQDILTADMVALKCKDCGSWLKWCPKDERKYYYANTQQKQDTKWQKLKEWLEEQLEYILFLENKFNKLKLKAQTDKELLQVILNKMKELEGEDE